jgi:hypothetical protein
VKYCPNPSCPHRLRVRGAAEFLAHITHCSDCGAELVVESEREAAEAFYANRSVEAGPYRGSAPKEIVKASAPDRSKHDVMTGLAFIGGGVLFSVICVLATLGSVHGARSWIAVGPIGYGIYRLDRGRSARVK